MPVTHDANEAIHLHPGNCKLKFASWLTVTSFINAAGMEWSHLYAHVSILEEGTEIERRMVVFAGFPSVVQAYVRGEITFAEAQTKQQMLHDAWLHEQKYEEDVSPDDEDLDED